MHKLGLKIWSSSLPYINPANDFYKSGVFDYVELYVEPRAGQDYIPYWEQTDFPFILHAPHYYCGFNFSKKENEENNRKIIQQVEAYRKILKPQLIIFHPGVNGTVEETIRQIQLFKGKFPSIFNISVIENKPKIGLKEEICVGASVGEITKILNETGLGLCLDIGHATCYSVWEKVGYGEILDKFLKLNPKMYHLSDGDVNSAKDMHLNFGEGNFELKTIMSKIPSGAYLSIETKKKSKLNLDSFKKDVDFLRNVYEKIKI